LRPYRDPHWLCTAFATMLRARAGKGLSKSASIPFN
jgi:hypothetical protein